MSLEIARIDPFDAESVDAWWAEHAAAERADRGEDAVVWTLEESRSELQQVSSSIERRAFLLRKGNTVVGTASVALPMKDNAHVAHLAVSVPPEHRRRGIGSAALALLEAEAAASDRTVAQATASWPSALGPDGVGSPGREFARHHGYELALGDVQSRLTLPLDPALLDRVESDIARAIVGYEIRSWTGPVPAEFVHGWAMLDASVDTEAPSGTLDIEAAVPDVAELREDEELLRRQNRISFGAVALTADGEVAAYSHLVVSGDDGNAYQWGTLVRRADRGHRLGTAVKTANLRMLQQEAPATPAVYTYNAESNTHMRAVNTLLGFRPSERMGELQKRLG